MSPRVGPRDPEATRAAILEAAEKIFVAGGFAKASVSAIARAAGVTKSLIHHHFGSKAELWSAVKSFRFQEYANEQRELLENADIDANLLRDSIVTYFRFLQRNPDMLRMMTWINLEQDTHTFQAGDALIALGAAKLRAAQDAGLLRRDVDPTHIVHAFLSLCQGWFQAHHHITACWQCGPEAKALLDGDGEVPPEVADEKYLESILKIIFEGIGPQIAAGGNPEVAETE